ncbi:MAG: YdeI/OmpD-associated family protein [Bizionia paragorgiae]|uniref:YdeI/OmpD-associated family protein n=1 Tax=Bizionia paragorgiae TaxID=283786 RepID=UPI003C4492B3
MKKATTVDDYIELHPKFGNRLEELRALLLSTGLKETLKWNAPVYTVDSKNIVGIGAFKNHYALWFFNGVFLKDKHKLLVNAQESTKALRQMRFDEDTIINKEHVLSYIEEAIQNHKSGKELKPERRKQPVVIPEELQVALQEDPSLDQAFTTLSNAKQREYCEHIASAKRETTKTTRLEKIKPLIRKGVGLHDKYKNC